MISLNVLGSVLFVSSCLHIIRAAWTQCEDGWFGPDCQYLCHCAVSAPCDKHDGSCSSGCHQDWFGPACQYASMAFNVTKKQKHVSWLTDKDDTTCNNGVKSPLLVKLEIPIHLSWIRVVVKDTATDTKINLKRKLKDNSQLKCRSKALVNKKTYDIVCNIEKPVKKFALFGSGVASLCSIYINKGRNLALKQHTNQSSTFEPWHSSHAVDGKLDIPDHISSQAATCTRTKERDTGWWGLTFSQPVDVYMFRIYNRINSERTCCEDYLKNFQLTIWGAQRRLLYNYTDQEEKPADAYIVRPKRVIRDVKVMKVQRGHNSAVLTLCEVEVFGEHTCGGGQYGLGCEHQCNCADQRQSCFVHSGGCPSGCASGFTGENCSACADGWFGPNCQYMCHCAGSAPCDKHDGSCSSGCHQDWFGPACQYASMAFMAYIKQSEETLWLTDKNDSTCNSALKITLKTSIPLSWIRVVLNDTVKKNTIFLNYNVNGANEALECGSTDSTAVVNDRTYDIVCDTQNPVEEFYLFGAGVKSLCSLFISAGRNVALKHQTDQSSTYKTWFSSRAVDGKLGILDKKTSQRATCSRTKNGNPGWWRLTFSQTVDVFMFHIYNRKDCCKRHLKKFQLTAWGSEGQLLYNYTNQEKNPADVYIVRPNTVIKDVKRVKIHRAHKNGILTLCEVEVFGELSCPANEFGPRCQSQCNCSNQRDSCFVHHGDCPSYCTIGYIGENCSECPAGTYGLNCSHSCSANCKDSEERCNYIDGTCTNGCKGGFRGAKCNSKCPAGIYGLNCSRSCSTNCKDSDESCNHIDGTCTNGCKDGFQGAKCDSKCLLRTYGLNCSHTCSSNCKDSDKSCNHIDGTCTNGCKDGFQGAKCNSKCEAGSYGIGCARLCSPHCVGSDRSCHHVSGKCDKGCNPGYFGDTCSWTCSSHCAGPQYACNSTSGVCEAGCDPGYFGRQCKKMCSSNCAGNKTCDQDNGDCDSCNKGRYGQICRFSCSSHCAGPHRACKRTSGVCDEGCKPGYRGPKCRQSCNRGQYGEQCKRSCSVHCKSTSCHHINGICRYGCEPGYHGSLCTQKCPAGKYGGRCLSNCSITCAGPENACNHVDGTCRACDPGYGGKRCKQECSTGFYGEGCNRTCSEHCGGNLKSCHRVNGSCNQGCDLGYMGPLCVQECAAGYYGKSCLESCSDHCAGDRRLCHHVNGTCSFGCSPGYNGALCKEECTKGYYGKECTNRCSNHCAGDKPLCHHVTGTCDLGCDPGYQGDLCTHECNMRKWGQNCTEKCSARCNNNNCHLVTGMCNGCVNGYWGEFCDNKCNTTTYGKDCGQRCSTNCVEQECHHETGLCKSCNESMIGDFCESARQQEVGLGAVATISVFLGALVVMLVILAVISGIFIWRRWSQRKIEIQENENDIRLSERTLRLHTSEATGEESEADSADDAVVIAQTNQVTDTTAVSVEKLKSYIQQHSADSHFQDQFLSIPMTSCSPQTCGVLPENIKKNRYKNIIPYDASRVLLQTVKGKKASDYINASFVKGYKSYKAFIASQGPNDFILTDFVRMLWEQKIEKIVMLTNLVEEGKKKCSMYWPVEGEEELGDLTVRLLTTHVFAEYTIRQLRLSKKGQTSRDLTQFHFTAWPDKSVPESPWGLVDLHQRVMAVPGSGPVLVHCSAGVGRTGTFIGLCNLLQEAEATGKMDFKSVLWKLRQDRMHTIQTVVF